MPFLNFNFICRKRKFPKPSKNQEFKESHTLMRMKGLEPPRVLARQILSLLRLPFRHIRVNDEDYSNTIIFGLQD